MLKSLTTSRNVTSVCHFRVTRPKKHLSAMSPHHGPGRKLPLTSSHLMTRIISAQETTTLGISYDVKTEDGKILCRNYRHLCRSREPFYSPQPREVPVALQPLDLAASPEKLQGPQPIEGQSFTTVPAQGDQSKQPTKTPVALSSEAQPLRKTLNKSQPVENKITRAAAPFS